MFRAIQDHPALSVASVFGGAAIVFLTVSSVAAKYILPDPLHVSTMTSPSSSAENVDAVDTPAVTKPETQVASVDTLQVSPEQEQILSISNSVPDVLSDLAMSEVVVLASTSGPMQMPAILDRPSLRPAPDAPATQSLQNLLPSVVIERSVAPIQQPVASTLLAALAEYDAPTPLRADAGADTMMDTPAPFAAMRDMPLILNNVMLSSVEIGEQNIPKLAVLNTSGRDWAPALPTHKVSAADVPVPVALERPNVSNQRADRPAGYDLAAAVTQPEMSAPAPVVRKPEKNLISALTNITGALTLAGYEDRGHAHEPISPSSNGHRAASSSVAITPPTLEHLADYLPPAISFDLSPPRVALPQKSGEEIKLAALATTSDLSPAVPLGLATSPRPPARPARPAAVTPKALVKPKAPVKTQPTPVAAAAPKPSVAAPSSSGRITVIGVFHTPKQRWALVELGNGRIVQAGPGSSIGGVTVTKIKGDRIWLNGSGVSAVLSSGQVLALK